MDDLFGSGAPPLRLETTFAGPHRARPSAVVRVPIWARVSAARGFITVVLVGGGAWWYLFPAWQVAALPAAAVACQGLRRWNAVRWASWSVILAAFGAEALVLGAWPLRFAACLLFVAPFVFFAGRVLRDI
jgi:hypothetical protein